MATTPNLPSLQDLYRAAYEFVWPRWATQPPSCNVLIQRQHPRPLLQPTQPRDNTTSFTSGPAIRIFYQRWKCMRSVRLSQSLHLDPATFPRKQTSFPRSWIIPSFFTKLPVGMIQPSQVCVADLRYFALPGMYPGKTDLLSQSSPPCFRKLENAYHGRW